MMRRAHRQHKDAPRAVARTSIFGTSRRSRARPSDPSGAENHDTNALRRRPLGAFPLESLAAPSLADMDRCESAARRPGRVKPIKDSKIKDILMPV